MLIWTYIERDSLISTHKITKIVLTQSAGAEEYTNCISPEM